MTDQNENVEKSIEQRRAELDAFRKANADEIMAAMKAAREAEAAKQLEIEAAVKMESEKARARTQWVANGGTDASFETAWPAIARRILEERTVEAVEAREKLAKRAAERWYRQIF